MCLWWALGTLGMAVSGGTWSVGTDLSVGTDKTVPSSKVNGVDSVFALASAPPKGVGGWIPIK